MFAIKRLMQTVFACAVLVAVYVLTTPGNGGVNIEAPVVSACSRLHPLQLARPI